MLYRAARRADPGYFPAQYEYITLMWSELRGPELRTEFPASDSSSSLTACLAAAARVGPDDPRPLDRLYSIERRFGPTPCTDAFLLALSKYSSARVFRAVRQTPELADIRLNGGGWLVAEGRWREAEALWARSDLALEDPLGAVQVAIARADLRLARQDTAGARAIWRSLDRHVRQGRRPGALMMYLLRVCGRAPSALPSSPALRASSCRELIDLVEKHPAVFRRWDVMRRQGMELLERGELRKAIPFLDRSVALADSIGTPGPRMISYTQRGRAFGRLGKLSFALRDLRQAIALGPAFATPYYLAEAYHNLAHTYEAAGRLADAAFAADTSALIADSLPVTSGRYMMRHDAGVIRWAAGWHAAAARDFDMMVRVVDEQNTGHFFAGEYFERVGNLSRAINYYRVGARISQSPDPRNFAGLARLHEALGFPDSAEAAARQHDAARDRWPLLERPLLPDVLARRGRVREAIALADAWARRELGGGDVQGAALAQLHLAELMLLAGHAKSAATAAATADSLSRLLKLSIEAVRARTLRGRALFEQGLRDQGLAELRDAVRLAVAQPSTSALLSTHLALGNALATSSRTAGALAAYDRAAVAVETMTAGLDEDVNRTGFKSVHLAPFDGALRVLAADPSAANAGTALEWSVRRKAAALRLAANRAVGTSRPASSTRLRGRLRGDEALIDFTLIDSTVLAIVARRESIALFRLAIPSPQLATWIEALRRPLVTTPGGRLDLAHAPFDMALAESLYTALITPLESRLAGVKRLAIVPDGVLWYVPFPALVSRRSSNGATYLIERYEARLLPSAVVLARGGGHALPVGFRVEALSYAVPGGEAEVEEIQSALGGSRVAARTGSAATEHAALSAGADVLHVAAHGVINDRDPLASHIRLAAAGSDDGLLHLSEIASSRTVPRIVVLTACEAVNGKLYAGEGLVGLARAFLLSGARQVIASHWPVDASAVELTKVFYGELGRGRDASTALRSAQLALLQRPRTVRPIHWAGFVVFEGSVAGSGAADRD